MSVIWHDLECGSYAEDLPYWRSLAQRTGGPVLDAGAGTGRTTLELARAGYAITAIDRDVELLHALRARARDLDVTTVVGDVRSFAIDSRFALCIAPMQTIQLLGGPLGRRRFLECARRHLRPGGILALAIADELELFDIADGAIGPTPDVGEIDGVVYSSRPTAVRAEGDGFVLERHRETVTTRGELSTERDLIHLDRLAPSALEREASAVGLRPAGRDAIPPTADYVGSTVVVLHA
ncbi:MAG: class I SAM-dependent methyltransferase [Solirubrobacteraceae bacterium]